MNNEPPFFSVIIPTYARPAQLVSCLESLARLDYPRERFEVVVVDDASATPPEDIVESFRPQLDVRLIVQRANAGPAAARNMGATHARGEYLAFTDDDCLPARSWLKAFAARFTSAPDRLLGGRTTNALDENPYSSTSQTIIEIVYAHFNPEPDDARFFASNNMAVPAEGFRAIRGFDETFRASEDRELCDRWLASGRRLAYAPDAVVAHAHPLDARTLWQQHFDYGRGAFRFHHARRKRGAGHFKPDLNFYLKLLGAPFTRGARGRKSLTLFALLLWTQAANTAGFLRERLKRK